jgi:hypothetical protein
MKKFKIVVKPKDEDPIVVLTRYLYIKQEVLASIALALIESNLEEALFWAYELYYSGFQEECMEFIPAVYREWYAVKNPKLGKFLNSQLKKWLESRSDAVLGTMIRNIMHKEFYINPSGFGAGLLNKPSDDCAKDNGFYVQIDPASIEKYKTIEKDDIELPYLVIRRACKYAARNKQNAIFCCFHKDISKEDLYLIYRDHWLYYASFSPIWRKRIDNYNGYINNELKKVTFENEDDEDEFYDEFGYEPEEQSKDLLEKWIGDDSNQMGERQMSEHQMEESYGMENLRISDDLT